MVSLSEVIAAALPKPKPVKVMTPLEIRNQVLRIKQVARDIHARRTPEEKKAEIDRRASEQRQGIVDSLTEKPDANDGLEVARYKTVEKIVHLGGHRYKTEYYQVPVYREKKKK